MRVIRVGLVGLGVIGRVHHAVLGARPDVRLTFVADPREVPSGLPATGPRFSSLADALDAGVEADLVVVATPTDSHLDLVGEALARTTATVLSEKPVSRDAALLERFRRRHAGRLDRVRTVNHFAFSPEVVWAAEVVAREGWGAPRRIFSGFDDPYVVKTDVERRTYVSSWVDSGSNQLAMLARFADGWRVTAHTADPWGLRSVTDLVFDGGSATLASNWWTGDSSKQTTLRWSDEREVLLDHTAMTGYLVVGGRVREHLGHDGRVDRKTAHYAAMYRALLDGSEEHLLGLPLACAVTDLLTEAVSAGEADPRLRWSGAGAS